MCWRRNKTMVSGVWQTPVLRLHAVPRPLPSDTTALTRPLYAWKGKWKTLEHPRIHFYRSTCSTRSSLPVKIILIASIHNMTCIWKKLNINICHYRSAGTTRWGQTEGQSAAAVHYLTCVLFNGGELRSPRRKRGRQGESMLTQHRKCC